MFKQWSDGKIESFADLNIDDKISVPDSIKDKKGKNTFRRGKWIEFCDNGKFLAVYNYFWILVLDMNKSEVLCFIVKL